MSADGCISASRRTPKFGGMDLKMAKQPLELPKENSRLMKLVADQALDMLILTEAARPHVCVAQLN
jgi:hypothetical protein